MTVPRSHVRAFRWWIILCAAIVLFALTYIVCVQTPTGQAFENAALRGADHAAAASIDEANRTLGDITVWTLGLATIAVAVVGLLRRQPLLSALAVGVIFFGQVVTQTLKRFILPRPELVEVVGDFTQNSFPSGHTTIAMTVLVAVFLVVPYRARGIVMFFVLPWSAGIGAYTLTAKWHRLSDTLGADLVALALGSVAALVLVRAGRVGPAPRLRFRFPRTALVIAFSLFTAAAAATGTVLAALSLRLPLNDGVVEWDIYLAVTTLATAGSLLSGLVYWASWRRLEILPAAPRRRTGRTTP